MSTAMQLVVNGVIAGGFYALLALGFTMIFGILKIIHFAHGAVFMIGAYVAWLLNFVFGVHIAIAFLISVLVCGLLGIAIEKLCYKPIRKKPAINSLIVALGLTMFLESVMLMLFGAQLKAFSKGPIQEGMRILGASITPMQIGIIITSVVLMVLLCGFIKYTKTGKAVRAATDNLEVASVIGIDTDKVISVVFFVGSMLAGAAGVLYGIEYSLVTTMGVSMMIKAFAASIVGGVGDIRGALVGGFLIGLAENIGVYFIPSGYKDAIAFGILILMLRFYPKGIFGGKVEEDIRQ